MSTKPDYTELDAAILEAIGQPGMWKFMELLHFTRPALGRLNNAFWACNGSILGARIQKLRRDGKIVYSRQTGWRLA